MYSSYSDYDLQVLITKDRNQSAFEELYNRYWDKVFAICNNRLQNVEASEDIIQDVFISLWQHQDLQGVSNMSAYLYQATKFSIIKYLNRISKYDTVDPQDIGFFDRLDGVDLNEMINYKEIQAILMDGVNQLPPQTKLIFQYSRIDQLNSKEIAEKLDISPRTVENQIGKALKVLRKILRNTHNFIFFLF
ncbi:RNA polymerase sigma-70 factor [Sphingobacterium bovistauri]|uniref:RNA polymerase sigma-70 factor n=1 Tax=Sphingobacterium bovistauri TaxID=2781959 RepID=A0ABS7Z8U9_9SPHI|nr:RNA polymerase sigma-70 factor [Sphingobacterium bovistauri]MCA5006621.1 RNA polymerase sigma-70 factor [Sphingobacterium bovistauri]